jgi:hypothetical protein
LSDNNYEEGLKYLIKETSAIYVTNIWFQMKYISKVLGKIICYKMQQSEYTLYTARGVLNDCIVQYNFCFVLYYTDQFHI